MYREFQTSALYSNDFNLLPDQQQQQQQEQQQQDQSFREKGCK